MGYKPNDKVDWEKFKQDIVSFPNVSPNEVIKEYEENWAPEPVARYLLSTVLPDFQL